MLEPHERALSLIGIPFRVQGRDPNVGLDCLGVVICAFELPEADVPRYRISDGDWGIVDQGLSTWFEPAADFARGDLLIFRLSRSFHFGVITGSHFVHADAAAGRVVVRRLPARFGRECRIFRFRGDC